MKAATAALTVALAACSSTAAPRDGFENERYSSHPATVLVTNATAVALAVRGYPSLDPGMPQPLGGMLRVGFVPAGATVCLPIPDTLFVTGTVVGSGQIDTTVWTSAQGVSLTGIDTAAVLETGGETAEFTPAGAAGWSVRLPAQNTGPKQARRCSP